MCTLFPGKSFGILLDTSLTNVKFLSLFSSEFLHFEVWFIDQNSKPPETEDRINLALVINWDIWDILKLDIQLKLQTEYLLNAMNIFLLLKI